MESAGLTYNRTILSKKAPPVKGYLVIHSAGVERTAASARRNSKSVLHSEPERCQALSQTKVFLQHQAISKLIKQNQFLAYRSKNPKKQTFSEFGQTIAKAHGRREASGS